MSTPGDQARASVLVKVPPAEAFRIFTEEIDQWWRRGRAYRVAGKRRGFIHIEPKIGGRMYESFETKSAAIGARTRVIETGRVLDYDPPRRLLFSWRAVNFGPEDADTEVEVAFEPSKSGTVVTVTHRGWSAIRDDHPARHGNASAKFVAELGMWWGNLLSSLRTHAAD